MKSIVPPRFTQAIRFEKSDSLLEKSVELFDSYFYFGGNRCVIRKIDGNKEISYEQGKTSFVTTALKIVSCCCTLGIFPLICLVGKGISRAFYAEKIKSTSRLMNPQRFPLAL